MRKMKSEQPKRLKSAANLQSMGKKNHTLVKPQFECKEDKKLVETRHKLILDVCREEGLPLGKLVKNKIDNVTIIPIMQSGNEEMEQDIVKKTHERLIKNKREMNLKQINAKAKDRINEVFSQSSKMLSVFKHHKLASKGSTHSLISNNSISKKNVQEQNWLENLQTQKVGIGQKKLNLVNNLNDAFPQLRGLKLEQFKPTVTNLDLDRKSSLRIASFEKKRLRQRQEKIKSLKWLRVYGKKLRDRRLVFREILQKRNMKLQKLRNYSAASALNLCQSKLL